MLVAKKALENSKSKAQFIGLSNIRVLVNRFIIQSVYVVVKFLLAKSAHDQAHCWGVPGIFAMYCNRELAQA